MTTRQTTIETATSNTRVATEKAGSPTIVNSAFAWALAVDDRAELGGTLYSIGAGRSTNKVDTAYTRSYVPCCRAPICDGLCG